jgi:hypothetical protein
MELALYSILLIALLCGGCISENKPSPTPAITATPAPVTQVIYISGIVLDQDGAPVPGARVALWQGPQLVQMPENPRYSNDGETGLKGSFNFTNLQPAHYQVAADIQGHKVEVDRRFNESTSIEVVIPGYSVSKVTPAPSQGPMSPGMPRFDVQRTGPTSVQIRLVSFGSNVTSLRGFYVKSPVISTQEVIPIDEPLAESQTILITDPNLTGTVKFIASSWVNGNYAIVVNTTV